MEESTSDNFESFKVLIEQFECQLFSPIKNDQLIPLLKKKWQSIKDSSIMLEKEYNFQKLGNDILLKEIAKLKFARGVDSVLLSFHQRNLNAAVLNLLIHPNPVDIKCTHKNVSLTYKVGVNDILLIKSRGRTKLIYLKKKFRPLEGGDEQDIIMVNKNGLDFDELLRIIQRNGNHILRIAQSYAVNIFQYELTSSNTFKLISTQPVKFDKKLEDIKTDKLFDVRLYHERLMEIDRLGHHIKDYEVNLKKIEEINRYKISQGIT